MNDLTFGLNSDEVLRMVKDFQYTDVHGEVCPLGWTPGATTILPDHESVKLAAFWANTALKLNEHTKMKETSLKEDLFGVH